jgi:hypothetical protein
VKAKMRRYSQSLTKIPHTTSNCSLYGHTYQHPTSFIDQIRHHLALVSTREDLVVGRRCCPERLWAGRFGGRCGDRRGSWRITSSEMRSLVAEG